MFSNKELTLGDLFADKADAPSKKFSIIVWAFLIIVYSIIAVITFVVYVDYGALLAAVIGTLSVFLFRTLVSANTHHHHLGCVIEAVNAQRNVIVQQAEILDKLRRNLNTLKESYQNHHELSDDQMRRLFDLKLVSTVEEFRALVELGNVEDVDAAVRHMGSYAIYEFINMPNAQGGYLIHGSIKKNHIEMLKWLVSHGADLTMKSGWGKTPLDLAQSDEVIEILTTALDD